MTSQEALSRAIFQWILPEEGFGLLRDTGKLVRSGWLVFQGHLRLELVGNTLSYIRFIDDFRVFPINNVWTDTGASGFGDDKIYVVQTASKIVERCLLMTTDPGDLVLDPTCGSGTTAAVAENWGRRWITIDTSRVALTLARARLMGAKYEYFLLRDSKAGRRRKPRCRVSRQLPLAIATTSVMGSSTTALHT